MLSQLVAKALFKGAGATAPVGQRGEAPLSTPPEAVTSEAEEHAEG